MILEAILAVNKMRLKVSKPATRFVRKANVTDSYNFVCTVIFRKRSKDKKLKQFELSGIQVNCVFLQEYPTRSFLCIPTGVPYS